MCLQSLWRTYRWTFLTEKSATDTPVLGCLKWLDHLAKWTLWLLISSKGFTNNDKSHIENDLEFLIEAIFPCVSQLFTQIFLLHLHFYTGKQQPVSESLGLHVWSQFGVNSSLHHKSATRYAICIFSILLICIFWCVGPKF